MGIKGLQAAEEQGEDCVMLVCLKADVCVCVGVKRVSSVIHSMHLKDTQAYAPIQPHVRQTSVECDHIAGH